MLSDFKKMSPEAMIDYYTQKITELSPPSSASDSLLIEVLRNLIDHNRKQMANRPAQPAAEPLKTAGSMR